MSDGTKIEKLNQLKAPPDDIQVEEEIDTSRNFVDKDAKTDSK